MKILVSAYACETGRGSEGEIAWRLILRLATEHDVFVITRANLRNVHEAAFVNITKPAGLNFVYFDLPWLFRFYKKGARFFLIYYYLWQLGVGILARRLVKEHQFDLLHHLTGGMDWMPSGLSLAPGKFLWGPVGSENTNPCILPYLPLTSRLTDRLRFSVRWWMRNLDPFVRLTGARADLILTHTFETMPLRYAHKLRAFTQTGIENSSFLAKPKMNFARNAPLKLVFAGELKDWKGARLALDAALIFFEIDSMATLTVVGDGPLRSEMEAITQVHPQGYRVVFLGKVPMNILVDELHSSDVFLYPSFHHGLATVVLQAMLTGLPVICIEGDATGRTIGEEAGITVTVKPECSPASDLAQAIENLASNEDMRQMFAKAAQRLAQESFNYNRLAKAIESIYFKLRK